MIRTDKETFTSIQPKQGVVTIFGYGTSVRVQRGHLVIEDGIGLTRRRARFPRVGHGLKRVVAIGSDGMVSLSALRWLSDQDAAFVMLDRNGKVLATTGPVSPSDVRVRRAQSLAHHSGLALKIAKELIGQKLVGQERVVRRHFENEDTADVVAKTRNALSRANTSDEVRRFEAQGALAYWSAWHDLAIRYPTSDLRRVPDHWQKFGSRMSPLTNSPRLASNPPNAMLNYLYAVLESESRLALSALGLDPGIGVLHNDTRNRDSLACDLMEPVRPRVDEFVLDWLRREHFRREWFFEERDGNCRLMGSFAVRLSETAHIWSRAVAPYAEWISHALSSEIPRGVRSNRPATRLTQRRRSEGRAKLAGLDQTKVLQASHFAESADRLG